MVGVLTSSRAPSASADAGAVFTPVPVGGEVTAPDPVPLDEVRALFADGRPLVISVLGDSTGNGTDEWVALWAADLGQSRNVVVQRWDPDTQAWSLPTLRFGSSGPAVEIWNGSVPGWQPYQATEIVAAIQPAKPDLVIYNYGHNSTGNTIATQMSDLHAASTALWPEAPPPAVAVLQNPALGERGARQDHTMEVLATWAAITGLPTIDVLSAFYAAGDLAPLMIDDVHPNQQGSRIWADTIYGALNGQ